VKEELVYLGVDIARSHLDAAIGAQKHRFCNDTVGHRQLVRWIAFANLRCRFTRNRKVFRRFVRCSDDFNFLEISPKH